MLPYLVGLILAEANASPLYSPNSAFWQWYEGTYSLFYTYDTTFYALNYLLVVRVYSEVIWQIPLFIYRKLFKKNNTVQVTTISIQPMVNNNAPREGEERWAEQRV